ncbi:type IV pilus twitching motility protein PilT [Candidatus Sumerlaeota bacterium]|nr:type IV pilus twitching motility protein PilT [Candidatus Sumerlaeota bacterium]
MLEMNQMLRLVVERDASDLHIVVGKPAVMRAGGTLDIVDPDILTPEDTERLMKEITPPRYQQLLQESGSADFAYSFSEQARFRTAVFRSRSCYSIVMRLIPSRILTFEELGLSEGAIRESIMDMLYAHRGLCLVTGPTGSGKTTTLATFINHINENRMVHILTIEDPIEYTHPHKQAIVNQRELHVDTTSFAFALRGALRQDPDVILVGELRDIETMEAALTAAETGHLVFGTLHTISAAQTVNRLIDAFPANQQEQIRSVLSVALYTVIAQTLLPRKDGKGRLAAYEIMHMTPAIQNLIRDHKVERIISMMQTSAKFGMITLDDFLLKLYHEDKVSEDVCLTRCHYPNEMRQKIMTPAFEEEEEEQAVQSEEIDSNTLDVLDF